MKLGQAEFVTFGYQRAIEDEYHFIIICPVNTRDSQKLRGHF